MCEQTACPDETMREGSRPIPPAHVLLMPTRRHVSNYGLISTLLRVYGFTQFAGWEGREMHQRPTYVEDVLNLQPGEWVHVRPLEEIRRTFDRGERTHGMRFMAAMGAYFGKKLRVYKRANVILLEGTAETRRLKNTVLLEGAICQGEGFVCDRSCFYFWKESWLKRVPPKPAKLDQQIDSTGGP